MARKHPKNLLSKALPWQWFAPHKRAAPGATPGSLTVDPTAPKPVIKAICYGPDAIEEHDIGSVAELGSILGRLPVTWINVDGLGDVATIQALGEMFSLHPLALEDVVNTHQRPKAAGRWRCGQ